MGVASYGSSSVPRNGRRRNGHQLGRGELATSHFPGSPATGRSLPERRSLPSTMKRQRRRCDENEHDRQRQKAVTALIANRAARTALAELLLARVGSRAHHPARFDVPAYLAG